MRKLREVFDGDDYNHGRDSERLGTQLERIKEAVIGKGFFTYEQIALMSGAPLTSIPAQIRNLKKARFGGYKVERRYVCDGVYVYSVLEPSTEDLEKRKKKEEEEKERMEKGFRQFLEMFKFARSHGYNIKPELRDLGSKLRKKYGKA